MHIQDRTFIITGASSGLGLATAQDLHQQGGYIALLDLNADAGQEAVKALGDASTSDSNQRAAFFEADVTDSDSIAAAIQGVSAWIETTGKAVGGIVSAAGVGNPGKVRSLPTNVLDSLYQNVTNGFKDSGPDFVSHSFWTATMILSPCRSSTLSSTSTSGVPSTLYGSVCP